MEILNETFFGPSVCLYTGTNVCLYIGRKHKKFDEYGRRRVEVHGLENFRANLTIFEWPNWPSFKQTKLYFMRKKLEGGYANNLVANKTIFRSKLVNLKRENIWMSFNFKRSWINWQPPNISDDETQTLMLMGSLPKNCETIAVFFEQIKSKYCRLNEFHC